MHGIPLPLSLARVHTGAMAAPDPEPDLVRFYTTHYVEDDRLRMSPHGRLELARTRELLRRRLGAGARRGRGTGVHARGLVEDGYQVHLVDLVPEHAAQATSIDGITTSVGDARRLEQPDGSVDAVLLPGPLYHLVSRRNRLTTASLHLPDELAGELHDAGLRDVEVLGVEGPTGPALDAHGLDRLEDLLPAAVRCARIVERDPALIAASAHLLAFGRA
jgi:hypothetical protein